MMDGAINSKVDFLVNSGGEYIQHGNVHAGRDAIFNARKVSMPVNHKNVDAVRDIIGNVSEWDSAGSLNTHGNIRLSGDKIRVAGHLHARGELKFDATTRVTNEGSLICT